MGAITPEVVDLAGTEVSLIFLTLAESNTSASNIDHGGS